MQRNTLFDYIILKNTTKIDDKTGKILVANSYEKYRVNVYYVNITFKLKNKTPKYNRWAYSKQLKTRRNRDFFDSPVVKTLLYNAGDVGSIPGHRAKIPTCLGAKKSKHKTEDIL